MHSICTIHGQRTPKISLRGSESGGYLLSHNKCSTIGVIELNDPVRNGKGWDLNAITTLIISLVFRDERLENNSALKPNPMGLTY